MQAVSFIKECIFTRGMNAGQVVFPLCSICSCVASTVRRYLRSPPFMMVITRQSSSFVWNAYASETIKRLCTFSRILFSTIAPCRRTRGKDALTKATKQKWNHFQDSCFSSSFLFLPPVSLPSPFSIPLNVLLYMMQKNGSRQVKGKI